MKIVVTPFVSIERDESSQWKLFTSNGDLAQLPILETLAPQQDVILILQSGSYWLLQMNKVGVSVRSIIIKDEYPISAKETLITDITSDFFVEGKDPSEIEELLKERSGYCEQLICAVVAHLKNMEAAGITGL